jgi:hypothetical protein
MHHACASQLVRCLLAAVLPFSVVAVVAVVACVDVAVAVAVACLPYGAPQMRCVVQAWPRVTVMVLEINNYSVRE